MDIPIQSNKEKFYLQALHIVSHAPPFNKLRFKELEVLAWLSYFYNDLKEAMGENDMKLVNRNLFDYDTRVKIREKIQDKNDKELSADNLSYILMGLKNKGFIYEEKGRKFLNEKYIFDPRRVDSITYKFHYA